MWKRDIRAGNHRRASESPRETTFSWVSFQDEGGLGRLLGMQMKSFGSLGACLRVVVVDERRWKCHL